MVRRFYVGSEKVTALRTNDKWIVNEIAATIPVDGYFWDKPGKYLGSVEKVGSKWEVRWHGADLVAYTRKTLKECVEFLVFREHLYMEGIA
jgi:hypothetical protein